MTSPSTPSTDMLFFVSDKRIGAMRPDGTVECYPQFNAPNQATWQMEYVFPDGSQGVLLSQEPPKNPNASFYDQDGLAGAKTHLWRYDFRAQTMCEIDLPPFMRLVGVIPGKRRFLVSGWAMAGLPAMSLSTGSGT